MKKTMIWSDNKDVNIGQGITWIEQQKGEANEEFIDEILSKLTTLEKFYPTEISKIKDSIKNKPDNISDAEFLRKIWYLIKRTSYNTEKNLLKCRDEFDIIAEKIYARISKDDAEKIKQDPNLSALVSFMVLENAYLLTMPKLKIANYNMMPFQDEAYVDSYLKDEIIASIKNYPDYRKLEKFKNYSLIFIHHYTEENKNQYDTDNLEIKKPIDAIDGFLIQNDTIKNSHIYQITVLDDEEFTEFYIVKGHKIAELVLHNIDILK